MSSCKIHNVRFYKPKPEAIYSMALQKSTNKLAVSRADSLIEIWNLVESAFIERTIPGSPDNDGIQGLAWCGDRLFSVDLNGFLIEYDLHALTKKRMLAVTGEAAFCLDVYKRQIAIGTEQGYLNIFNVEDDDVLFEKFLDKQEGRILCLTYDASGKFIISGSVDAIRIWNVSTGHALHKMTTGRSETNKPTIVWCLCVLNDFTIISGDSRGKVTFWDGKVGAQIESYQTHKADVLALSVSEDEKSLYCAGADPNIMNYVKVNVKGENHKWVKSVQRKVHDHDIRSLILCNEKLYSGGTDGYLSCSYYPPKTLIKYPPVLQPPCVVIAELARYILLRYTNHLEVWSMGKSADIQGSGLLPLEVEPKQLLTLQRTIKENGKDVKEGIICGSISSDGSWIVYSTDTALRLFRFTYVVDEKPELTPVYLPENSCPCLQAVFSSDNSKLVLVPRTGGLSIYNLKDVPILMQHIKTTSLLKDTITFLMLSLCGQYLVAADPGSNIVVWKLSSGVWLKHCKLPRYHIAPTAVAVRPDSKCIIAVYADHKIVEFSLKTLSYTKFSRSLDRKHVKSWPNRLSAVRNVTFDIRNDNVIILHDDSSIVIINREKPLPESDAKIPKIESTTLSDSSDSFKSTKHAFHAIKKYKHLVHLGWLSNDEMVAVEVSPLSILEQLPPCFKQNKFGTK